MTNHFISLEDAAELTGYSTKHLRKLTQSKQVVSQNTANGLEIEWADVKRLASSYKPFWVSLPDSALIADEPVPSLLLHSNINQQNILPVESFHDKIELGSCVDWMKRMPDKIIQSVVTSPPYWGVRKYPGDIAVEWANGERMSYGEEPVVEGYVAHTMEILRHLKRVLKDDGTIWWNVGDTYQTRAYLRESSTERLQAIEGERNDVWSQYPNKRYSSGHPYLKDKDLTLVPFLVAYGAERLGFYVRSIIIWHKDNAGIDSAKDRPSAIHEYILLLAKSRFYKYALEKATEDAVTGEVIKRKNGGKTKYETSDQRNIRTVWKFPPSSKHGDHVAAFPMELPLRCLRLSTEPGDLVFDPFAGSGTTLAAAHNLGCHYFGTDILTEFVDEAKRRLESPLNPLSKKKTEASTQPKLLESPSVDDEYIVE